eukprot:CAMPEP_0197190364 /NCGR_PEP_ID=MMETSP1423-20130617/21516_1 /TAXON_ID=476441 /ORGANISM="Pseudo-nitzschia heimii, Strain UNC1101" /LENGTH=672 /DNA_ID=CAMNT_0042642733 /DNA_START=197 /DNA_END=2215 /DNA_ORIENTATION=-
MVSPFRSKHTYRLSKPCDKDPRPSKRFKTTGDDFVLRQLNYYKDRTETNDEIHESIELCPVSTALVNTEVFQRLRKISQLANAQYIYTCANHNRFQHSLGVAFLAEKMCKTVKEEQPQLGATDKDVLCVKLAGLLHDLGHGPYSHLYEAFRENYLPKFLKTNPDLREEYNDCNHLKEIPHWSHEQSSLLFIDSMLEELGLQIDLDNLDKPLRQIGDGIDSNSMRVFKPPAVKDRVLTSRDFLFIKECILGGPLEGFDYFVGRKDKKLEWLYDIVNNRHNGLDVDKIDYFARDHTRAIGKRGIDIKMITDARVAKGLFSRPEKRPTCKGKTEAEMHYMICYPDKHVAMVMNFFKHRLYLHKIIYQHKKNHAVENMICNIFCLADPYLRLQSHTGEKFPMSRAYLKSDFLVRIDDSILSLIEHSTDERLAEARELCRRFKRHDLYKCAVDQPLSIDNPVPDMDDLEGETLQDAIRTQRDIVLWDMSEADIQKAILNLNSETADKLEANDFIVKKYCMHHGAKDKNPLLRVRFFDKIAGEKLIEPAESLPIAKQADVSRHKPVIPNTFQWVGIRLLVRDDRKRSIVNSFFHTLMFNLEMKSGQGVPEQSVEPTLLFHDGEEENEDENGEWQERGSNANPALLSQDFDESGEEEEDDTNFMTQRDLSPIPVRSRGL